MNNSIHYFPIRKYLFSICFIHLGKLMRIKYVTAIAVIVMIIFVISIIIILSVYPNLPVM